VLRVIKIHVKSTIYGLKTFQPTTMFKGPWEGLVTETPLPNMHSLAQTMRNKPHLRRNKNKIQVAQV
jgi:hypothetical protein